MTPEYLNELADLADPNQLWRLSGMDRMDLPPEKRLRELQGTGLSLLITPLSPNSTATLTVPTPAKHKRLVTR